MFGLHPFPGIDPRRCRQLYVKSGELLRRRAQGRIQRRHTQEAVRGAGWPFQRDLIRKQVQEWIQRRDIQEWIQRRDIQGAARGVELFCKQVQRLAQRGTQGARAQRLFFGVVSVMLAVHVMIFYHYYEAPILRP